MAYDAFISYSHSADAGLAPDLQSSLQRFIKPWYRRRPFLRVLRDATSFGPSSDLGDTIHGALDECGHFVLLLSPESASSPWINAEVTHWLATKGVERMTFVVTSWGVARGEGEFDDLGGFRWSGPDVPEALRGEVEEPLAVDMRWATDPADRTLENDRWRDQVAEVAAAIRGQKKDELIGEVVTMHQRARILTGTLALAGTILLTAALGSGFLAFSANRAADDAEARELEAQQGARLAEEAQAEAEGARDQALADLESTRSELSSVQDNLSRAQNDLSRVEASLTEVQAQLTDAEARVVEARAAAQAAEAERDAARQAEALAVSAREKAEADRTAADAARAEADRLREAAEVARQDAEIDRDAAERAAALAADAEQAAREAEALARTSQAAAEQAQAEAVEARDRALDQQAAAEAQALSVSLAASAAEQDDPSLAGLLAVESYCALQPCAQSVPDGGQAFEASATTEDIRPLLPLVGVLGRHQDLIRTLPGWGARTLDVAVSDSGATVAAVAEDGRVRVWDAARPEGVDVFAPGDAVAVAVSSDGTTIAVFHSDYFDITSGGPAGVDERISLVTLSGGEREEYVLDQSPAGSPSHAGRLDFRPGSNRVVLVQAAFDLLVLDGDREPSEQTGPRSSQFVEVTGLVGTWTPDGTLVTLQDGGGQAWDAAFEVPTPFTIDGLGRPTVAVRGPRSYAVGDDTGTVFVPSLIVNREDRHTTPVADLAFGADGDMVISAGTEGDLKRGIRNTDFSRVATPIDAPTEDGVLIAGAPGADVLIVARGNLLEYRTAAPGWADAESAWARRESKPLLSRLGAIDRPGDVVSGNGEVVGTIRSSDGLAEIRSASDGALITTLTVGAERMPYLLALSEEGDRAAMITAGEGPDRVALYDAEVGALEAEFEVPGREDEVRISGVLVSRHVVVVRSTHQSSTSFLRQDWIDVWRLDGTLVRSVEASENPVGFALTPGSKGEVLVASPDGGIVSYPVSGAEPTSVLDVGTDDLIRSIGVDATDRDVVLVGFESGAVELWDRPTRVLLASLSRHSGPVVTALVGSDAAGNLILGTIGDLSFAGSEMVVRRLEPDELRSSACNWSGRNLTESEWLRFVGNGEPQVCARGL